MHAWHIPADNPGSIYQPRCLWSRGGMQICSLLKKKLSEKATLEKVWKNDLFQPFSIQLCWLHVLLHFCREDDEDFAVEACQKLAWSSSVVARTPPLYNLVPPCCSALCLWTGSLRQLQMLMVSSKKQVMTQSRPEYSLVRFDDLIQPYCLVYLRFALALVWLASSSHLSLESTTQCRSGFIMLHIFIDSFRL